VEVNITFNFEGDFTRFLGLKPEEYEKNIDTLLQGHTIESDVGFVTSTDDKDSEKKIERYFLNISSFGSSGAIMMNVNSSSTIINSDITYLFQTLRTTLFTNNFDVKFHSDINKEEIKQRIMTVAICNGIQIKFN
jgi:diacylglycerol kinase family enzyme